MGLILILAAVVISIIQAVVGYAGIEHHLGMLAGFVAVTAAVFFRFMLPLSIGSYFGAVDVFGWPWWGGVLIAAPGLMLIAPSALWAVIESYRSKS